MSNTQKNYIAEVSAGIRQVNIFKNMMDSWTTSTDLYKKALDSSNFAQERQNIYLTSSKAKMEQFKNTMSSIFQQTVSSESLNSIVTVGTKIMEAFSGVAKTVGIIPTLITTVVVAMSMFSKMNIFAGMTGFAKQFSTALSTVRLNAEATGIKLGTLGAITQAFGMTSLATATKVVLLNAAITMGLSFAIMGAITLIGKVINASAHAKEVMAELNTEIKQQNEALTQLSSLTNQYDDLSKSIDNAKKSGKDSTDQQKELLDIQKQIAQILPETTTKIDGENNSYATNRDIIQEVIDKKKEKLKIDVESAITTVAGIQNEVESYKKAREELDKLEEARNNNKPVTETKTDLHTGKVTVTTLTDAQVVAEMKKYNDQLTSSEKIILDYNANVEKYNTLTGTQKYKIIDITDATKINTKEVETNNKAIADQIAGIEKLQGDYDTANSKISDFNKYIKELDDSHSLSGDSIQNIVSKYPELISYLGSEKTLREKLSKIIADEKKSQVNTLVEMAKNDVNYYNTKLKVNVDLVNALKDKYGVDLANYKNLASAKEAVDIKLLKSIAKIWADYYNTLGIANPNAKDLPIPMVDPNKDKGIGKADTLGNIENPINLFNTEKLKKAAEDAIIKAKTNAKKFSDDINKFITTDFSKIDLNFDPSKTKDKTSSSSTVSTDTIDKLGRYASLNEKIAESDSKIAEIESKIQDPNISLSKHLELLKQENAQLTIKENLYKSLNVAQTKEQASLTKTLSKYINKDGTIDSAQYDKDANSAEKSKVKKQIDNIKEIGTDLERYKQVRKDIVDTTTKEFDIQNKINGNLGTANKLIQDDSDAKVKALEDYNKTQQDFVSSNLTSEFTRIDNSLVKYDDSLKDLKNSYDLLDSTNYDAKSKNIAQQTDVLNAKIAEENSALEYLKTNWSDVGFTQTEYDDYVKKTKDNIVEQTQQVKLNTIAIKDNAKAKADADKQMREEQIKTLNDLESQIESALEKRYQAEEKKQKESLDNQLTALEKSHSDKIDEINKYYDDIAKIEDRAELDRVDNAKKASLQDRILHSTDEVEKFSLNQELIKLQQDMDKRHLTESRADEKESRLKTENDSYETLKNSLQDKLKALDDYYNGENGVLNKAKLASEAETLIITKNQEVMVKLLGDYGDKSAMSFGERLVNGLQPYLDTVKAQIASAFGILNSLPSTVASSTSSTTTSSSDSSVGFVPTPQEVLNGEIPWGTFQDQNEADIWLRNHVPSFDTGGYTGNDEGLAYLHSKEIILNEFDTSNILKSVDLTKQMFGNLSNIKMPDISNMSNIPNDNSLKIDNVNLQVSLDQIGDVQKLINTISGLRQSFRSGVSINAY